MHSYQKISPPTIEYLLQKLNLTCRIHDHTHMHKSFHPHGCTQFPFTLTTPDPFFSTLSRKILQCCPEICCHSKGNRQPSDLGTLRPSLVESWRNILGLPESGPLKLLATSLTASKQQRLAIGRMDTVWIQEEGVF